MEYPITVTKTEFDDTEAITPKVLFGGKVGDFVSVRPCGDKYEDKTYLGILLGEAALSPYIRFNKESGVLKVGFGHHNPAMFVPDLNEIIYGCGSWWGKIKDEKQLREITDDDISNVWYVKAMKQLSEAQDPHNGR